MAEPGPNQGGRGRNHVAELRTAKLFFMATRPGEPVPTTTMATGIRNVTVCNSPEESASRAAAWVSGYLKTTIAERGTVRFAVSGGNTPAAMFKALATYDIDWRSVHFFQVDERLAPEGSADRNLTQLQACLLDLIDVPAGNVHPMPVNEEMPPDARAHLYEQTLSRFAPDGLDLVHLGLGSDGHTASLLPGDPALGVADRGVTFTGLYKGFRRLTLTYPELAKAHAVLWLAPGADKAQPLKQLLLGDPSIPAGRVRNHQQSIFCDKAAAAQAISAQLIVS
jgi:6-phosphogluconolactonase